jgi:hypothetical protein
MEDQIRVLSDEHLSGNRGDPACGTASKNGCIHIHMSTRVALRVAGFAWASMHEGQRLWTAIDLEGVCR